MSSSAVKTLGFLAGSSQALGLQGDPATPITEIQFDSRLIQPGNLFVALRGGYVNGHDFINDAIERGASAIATEHPVGDVPSIVFSDTREALPDLATAFFDKPSESLSVIGITGTDGKTTTSYLVDAILRHGGLRTGMIGTVSVKIGDEIVEHETRQTTPESLEIQRYLASMRAAGVTHAVLEATSHGLVDHRLDRTRFAIGAVTNITHEHLERHGTIEAYWRAKATLFEWLGQTGGWAIVNMDDEGARSVLPYADEARLLTYGSGDDADLRVSQIECDIRGIRFSLTYESQTWPVSVPHLGEFNAENAACAVSIGLAAGVSIETAVSALASAPAVPGRLAMVDQGQPFTVVVDYAHTPESLAKVLDLLRRLNPEGRLIAISGSAGERDVLKRPLQGRVSAERADISIFTSEDPRFEDEAQILAQIAAGALEIGKIEGIDFHLIEDRREAISFAMGLARPGDAVLLAGKGHEASIIVGATKVPWNESKEARQALIAAGYGDD